MVHRKTTRNTAQTIKLSMNRFRSWADARGLNFESWCKVLPDGPGHVRHVFQGDRRASPALIAAMQESLGPAGWRYITGQSDTLVAPPMKQEAA